MSSTMINFISLLFCLVFCVLFLKLDYEAEQSRNVLHTRLYMLFKCICMLSIGISFTLFIYLTFKNV